MTDQAGGLDKLIELSKVDVLLAQITLEKRKIDAELHARREAVKAQDQKREAKLRIVEERRVRYNREEKLVTGEKEKLVDRRKALTTLGSYKLQQAASKEIDYASKQLSTREEATLTLLQELSVLEKELQELEGVVLAIKGELEAFEKDAAHTLGSLAERATEYVGQRPALAAAVTQSQVLVHYDRVRHRYPLDPIVAVSEAQSCTGCRMKVGPQVFVQISRGEIVKCPGCGRLLKLP